MENVNDNSFHRLYGKKRPRILYQSKDFIDYTFMILISAAAVWLAYGGNHFITKISLSLCAFMIVAFPLRHGFTFSVPLIVRRPQDIVYFVIHKLKNLKRPYFIALGILAAGNLIIILTPQLPHNTELAQQVALYLFYIHLGGLTAYRTAILISHLSKKNHVREVIMQTAWKARLEQKSGVLFEILHAYFTGILTHIIYLVPWYLVITYLDFSMILIPATCVAAVFIQKSFSKVINDWFYRDHWTAHNSELEFLYLHGSHHDAIPSGMIGVAGNGYLEGLSRGLAGFPTPFYNPLMAAVFYTIDIKIDIDSHQFIPGVFPLMPREFYEVTQHSIHHYGRLEPYSFGINLDRPDLSEEIKKRFSILPDELKYSAKLDQQLTGFEWENKKHKWFLELVDKYQKSGESSGGRDTRLQ